MKNRSRMMAGIRSADTKPERQVRSTLHKLGFRFARTSKGLIGRPDIVLPRWNVVIFIHGCFWHKHECRFFKLPQSNIRFWDEKLAKNHERDERAVKVLLAANWKVLTIWECALRGSEAQKNLQQNMNGVATWIRHETEDTHCVLSGTELTYYK